MTGRPSDWTDHRIELLKTMWAEGLGGSVIAARLGITKSAVLGKVFRLELPSRDPPKNMAGMVKPPKAPPAAIEAPPVVEEAAPEPAAAEVKIEPAPEPVREPELVQLKMKPPRPPKLCNWPLWGTQDKPTHRYCEKPVEEHGYCAVHARKAFVSKYPARLQRTG